RTQQELRTTVEGSSGTADETISNSTPGKTDEEVVSKDQEYEIDKVTTNVVRAPGTVSRLTASVFVASKAMLADNPSGSGNQVTYENRTPEQLAQLQAIVANALGIDPEDASTGTVTIQEMVFAGDPVSFPSEVEEETSFNFMEVLQFGEEIIGSIVALVLFFVFFQMYRKFKSQPNPFEEFNKQAARYSNGGGQASAAEVTPELLNELIRQKPENAAVTLRGWMNESEAE
ncbi:MAG: hypothetical protein KJT03_16710, partial [Verrucomicrobiae bacterium]|nr:hypothetical protein [Verrucomicrobiae bacterium]